MPFREVGVFEVREVLRLWVRGTSLRSISRLTGLDRKTVRRYVEACRDAGVWRGGGEDQLTEGVVGQVIGGVRPRGPEAHGDAWRLCVESRESLRGWVEEGLRLTKVQELLRRQTGEAVPYRTLHRFAVEVGAALVAARMSYLVNRLKSARYQVPPAASWRVRVMKIGSSPKRSCSNV